MLYHVSAASYWSYKPSEHSMKLMPDTKFCKEEEFQKRISFKGIFRFLFNYNFCVTQLVYSSQTALKLWTGEKSFIFSQQIHLPPIQKLFVIEKLFIGFYYLKNLKLTEILQLDCTQINWHFSYLLKLQVSCIDTKLYYSQWTINSINLSVRLFKIFLFKHFINRNAETRLLKIILIIL